MAAQGQKPVFMQLYMLDPKEELGARMPTLPSGTRTSIDETIIKWLQGILHKVNPYVQGLLSARMVLAAAEHPDELKQFGDQTSNRHCHV